jgi:glucose/arabinose dehydrogenase
VPLRLTLAALIAAALAVGCGGNGSSSKTDNRDPAVSGGSPAAGVKDAGSRRVRLAKVGRFASPVYLTAPQDDMRRLFVVERAGRIRVVLDGKKRSAPFLDIARDVRTDSERGLLSMAFAPDYADSGLFYVYFTDRRGDIHIQEFRRSASDPNRARRDSRRNLLTVGHRRFGNHDGGQLQFGPDGFLYAGLGDGGGAGDPFRNGQSLRSDLGKIIRIDPSKRTGGRPFGIPAGNPFRSRRGAPPEIWAYGLRNPWRFSFDRTEGDLVIADVGQDSQEEIDFVPRGGGAGANFGWSVFEGRRRYRSGSAPGARRPVHVTRHSRGYCSITGGYVVRDRSLQALYGRYLYGDLCKPAVRSARLSRGRARGDSATGLRVGGLVSFGEDARGRVYAVSINGPVYRLTSR